MTVPNIVFFASEGSQFIAFTSVSRQSALFVTLSDIKMQMGS